MQIRTFLKIILLLCSIYTNLSGEINFEMDYNIQINPELGYVANVSLSDINSDANDEIIVDQISDYSGCITVFSQAGEILYENFQTINDNEKFIRSSIYTKNNINYLICTSSLQFENSEDLYFQVKTYDLINGTLLDSCRTLLFDEGNIYRVYNINTLNSDENDVLYVGIEYFYSTWDPDYYGITQSYLLKYHFLNGLCCYFDTIENSGKTFEYYGWSNKILSIGYEEIETFTGGAIHQRTRNFTLNKISNENNYVFEEIISILGWFTSDEFNTSYHDYPRDFNLISQNDIHQQNYGSVLFYYIKDSSEGSHGYYICYSPDLNETLWTQEHDDPHHLKSFSCLNPSNELPENYYVIRFSKWFDYFEVLDRINGQIVLEQLATIEPEYILRTSSQGISLIDLVYEGINVYSICGEYVSILNGFMTDQSILDGITNYPNPFNPTTTIFFSIPEESKVNLTVYNTKGQKVKLLVRDQFSAGEYSIVWDGKDDNGKVMGSGIYFYKLNVNSKTEAVKKCLLLK